MSRSERSAAASGRRAHGSLPHTADAGISATAADLPALFEEIALALVELDTEWIPGH